MAVTDGVNYPPLHLFFFFLSFCSKFRLQRKVVIDWVLSNAVIVTVKECPYDLHFDEELNVYWEFTSMEIRLTFCLSEINGSFFFFLLASREIPLTLQQRWFDTTSFTPASGCDFDLNPARNLSYSALLFFFCPFLNGWLRLTRSYPRL